MVALLIAGSAFDSKDYRISGISEQRQWPKRCGNLHNSCDVSYSRKWFDRDSHIRSCGAVGILPKAKPPAVSERWRPATRKDRLWRHELHFSRNSNQSQHLFWRSTLWPPKFTHIVVCCRTTRRRSWWRCHFRLRSSSWTRTIGSWVATCRLTLLSPLSKTPNFSRVTPLRCCRASWTVKTNNEKINTIFSKLVVNSLWQFNHILWYLDNFTLSRVLLQIYPQNKEPIQKNIGAVVQVLHATDSTERGNLLQLCALVAKDKPAVRSCPSKQCPLTIFRLVMFSSILNERTIDCRFW